MGGGGCERTLCTPPPYKPDSDGELRACQKLGQVLANARPPGSAKFANAPSPGLKWRANARSRPGGGGGGGGLEATGTVTDV